MKYQPRNRVNSYLTKHVADVCLNCKLKQCANKDDGCEAYRAAIREVSHRATFDGKTVLITVNGITHTGKEWAELLKVSRNALYRRSYKYNRTMVEEIEERLKERSNG